MERNVIYFPYIRVPDNEWFMRVLLYWDKVGSIVPMDYVERPSKLGEYMQGLVKEELVKMIIPVEYCYEIPNFTSAFLDYVDNESYPISHGILRRQEAATFKVHMEKLGDIGHELIQRGLARHTQDSRWYDIECYTADQFMTYLAAALGKLPEIKSDPVTDSTASLNAFTPEENIAKGSRQEIDNMRTVVLDNILPAPRSSIDPYEIAKFKDDHKRELNRFQNQIESFLVQASSIENLKDRSKMIKEFTRGINDNVEELTQLMKDRHWKNISFGRFLAYSAAGVGLSSAVSSSGGLIAAVAAALGIGTAIYTTIKESGASDVLEGQYNAYAVLSRKRFFGREVSWLPRFG